MIDDFYYFDKSTRLTATNFVILSIAKSLSMSAQGGLALNQQFTEHFNSMQVWIYFISWKVGWYCLIYATQINFFLISLEDSSTRFNHQVYLLFYHSSLQLFKNINMFLQREDPIIPVFLDQLLSFVKNLVGKFVSVAAIRNAGLDVTSIQYGREMQLNG